VCEAPYLVLEEPYSWKEYQREISERYTLFYPILGKKGYNHAGFEGTIGYREKEGFSEFDQNRPAAINREMSNS